MKYWYVIIMGIFPTHLSCIEYVYPLFCLPPQEGFIGDQCVVLYQNDYNHTELWSWNSITKVPHKLLLALYNPAGVCLLPNASGFSFIDNDRIRIKYFHKRSVKTLEFLIPLYDLTLLQWVNAQSCIFSAKEHGSYRLYYGTLSGLCACIFSTPEGNALHPHKIGPDLFFIKRHNASSVFSRIDFPNQIDTFLVNEVPLDMPQEEDLYTFSKPAGFLTMQSAQHGYVVLYPQEVERSTLYIDFDYGELSQVHGQWQCTKLFTFAVPTSMLIGQEPSRLHESLLPLIPKVINRVVYYFNADTTTGSLDLYAYSLDNADTKKLSAEPGTYCSVCPAHNALYYGGLIHNEQESLPSLHIIHNKLVLDLPSL